MDYELFKSLSFATLVPAAILFVAWKNRIRQPITARLFIAGGCCLLIPLGVWFYEDWAGWNVVAIADESGEQIVDETYMEQFDPGTRRWWRMIGWQAALSSFDIVAWSLMAWAILRQPDERRRQSVT